MKLDRLTITLVILVFTELLVGIAVTSYQIGRLSMIKEVNCRLGLATEISDCPEKKKDMSGIWAPIRCDVNENCV